MSIYIDRTVPFANPYLLQSHFERHKDEVGAATEEEYERLADAFMSQAPHPDLYDGTCTQVNHDGSHDRVRLDDGTRWFAVAYGALTVRTLHVKPRAKITKAGGPRAFIDRRCLETR